MANFEKLSDSSLECVIGGSKMYVNTRTDKNAVLRSGPGTKYAQISSLSNGTTVLTTGESVDSFEDGRTWLEIYEPVHGWIASSLLE